MAYQIQYGTQTTHKRKRTKRIVPLFLLFIAIVLRIWQPHIGQTARLLMFPPKLQEVFSDTAHSALPASDAIAVFCDEIFVP